MSRLIPAAPAMRSCGRGASTVSWPILACSSSPTSLFSTSSRGYADTIQHSPFFRLVKSVFFSTATKRDPRLLKFDHFPSQNLQFGKIHAHKISKRTRQTQQIIKIVSKKHYQSPVVGPLCESSSFNTIVRVMNAPRGGTACPPPLACQITTAKASCVVRHGMKSAALPIPWIVTIPWIIHRQSQNEMTNFNISPPLYTLFDYIKKQIVSTGPCGHFAHSLTDWFWSTVP